MFAFTGGRHPVALATFCFLVVPSLIVPLLVVPLVDAMLWRA